MEHIYFEIKNNQDLAIKADLRFLNDDVSKPLIILAHGFKGFRNWGFMPVLALELALRGFAVVNFDFSMNAILDENKQVYDAELFAHNTVSREVEDLKTLIDGIEKKAIPNLESFYPQWDGKIHLTGHSLGGAVSLITTSEVDKIASLTLLASISDVNRNTERQKLFWKEKGYMEVNITASNQVLKLLYNYQQDKDDNKERFNLKKIISEITIPVLILHGQQDITVPVREGEALYNAAVNSPKRKIELIDKCNHVFNSLHPTVKSNKQIDNLVSSISEFLLAE